MATRRKKSIDDIFSQYQRILRYKDGLVLRDADSKDFSQRYDKLQSRVNRAGDAALRYMSNIRHSKSGERVMSKLPKLQGDWNYGDWDKYESLLANRKYSQRTYMGKVGG